MKDAKGNTLTIESAAKAADAAGNKAGKGSKPKPPVDANAPVETKAQRFTRLVNRRVPKALKCLEHVANLASLQSYDYTPEQAAKIVGALTAALKRLSDRFAGQKEQQATFQL